MIPVIILLVIVGSIGAFAYPSVTAPFYSTQTNIDTSTYVQTFTVSNAISSYGVSYYYQTNLNQVIIPDLGGGCSGPGIGPFPPCFYAITATGTRTLSVPFTVTLTSIAYATISHEQVYTNLSTHTQYQQIPLFTSFGLSLLQFVIVALLIIVIGAIAIIYLCNAVVMRKRFLDSMPKES